MRHRSSRTLTRRSHKRYFQCPKCTQNLSIRNFFMSGICFRQITPIHTTTPQVVRAIKGGSIPRKVTNTIQECGTGIFPRYRTGQPTISRKVWYTIPYSGIGGTIVKMATEGRVYVPKRRYTKNATPNQMQRSGGRNPQTDRRSNKLERYESRHKEPDPGI